MSIKEKLEKDSKPCICDTCSDAISKAVLRGKRILFRNIMEVLNKELVRFERPHRKGVAGFYTNTNLEEFIQKLRNRIIETME